MTLLDHGQQIIKTNCFLLQLVCLWDIMFGFAPGMLQGVLYRLRSMLKFIQQPYGCVKDKGHACDTGYCSNSRLSTGLTNIMYRFDSENVLACNKQTASYTSPMFQVGQICHIMKLHTLHKVIECFCFSPLFVARLYHQIMNSTYLLCLWSQTK